LRELDQALAPEPGQGRNGPGAPPVLLSVAIHPIHHAFRALGEPLENAVPVAFAPAHPGAFVIDAPGSGGKVPVNPEYVLSHNADRAVIRNFEGKVFEYSEAPERKPVLVAEELDDVGLWKD